MNFFITNPSLRVQAMLTQRGIKLATKLEQGGETYMGTWISQKCARKIYLACLREGEIDKDFNYAFVLFERSGRAAMNVPPRALPAALGVSRDGMTKQYGASQQLQNLAMVPATA